MDTIHDTTGCFYRALDDEPVFVLLARDPVAAETVRWWVTLRQALIGAGQKPLEDHGALAEALETAQAMVTWRDDATGVRPEYDNKPRWKVETAPERLLVDRADMTRIQTRLQEDMETFLFYCQQHVNKGTLESDRKASVNYDHACEIANLLQQPKPELPKPSPFAASRVAASAPGSTVGGEFLPYEEWIDAQARGWHIGNRFLIWPRHGKHDAPFGFFENRNYATPEETKEDWTGWYPLQNSLQRDIIVQAYKDRFGRAETPFIAVDLAAKVCSGLRDMVKDPSFDYDAGSDDFHSMADKMDAMGERIKGFADQLEEGRLAGERLRSRTISMSADTSNMTEGLDTAKDGLLMMKLAIGLSQVASDLSDLIGNKTGARVPLFTAIVDRINGFAVEAREAAPFTDKSDGEYIDKIILDTLKSKPDELKRIIGKHPALGEPYGGSDAIDFDALHHEWIDKDGKARSDTIDVTDTPALPPHRFTIFTKGRQWAYGRGLEISPSHIPAMLDAMEKDGWTLQAVFGGTVADKVAMLFKRRPRTHVIGLDSPDWRDIGKGWSKNQDTPEGAPWSKPRGMEPSRVYVGRWFGRDLWLDGNVTSQALQQLKDRITAGEAMVDMGRGQQP